MKNYVGFSRDHSGSMYNIARPAARDYNDNIASIKEEATANNIDTVVSVVKCGAGRPAAVVTEIVNSSVAALQPLMENAYVADGNSTPLFDSVGKLIEMFEAVPDVDDPEVSFLIMVITDGQENSSKTWSGQRLSKKIKELQATDRWTFVFRVPRGSARDLASFGIPEGNILEWDQTERGVQKASTATRAAFKEFYKDRASGVKSTQKFYANVANLTLNEVKTNLDDISGEVNIWPVYSGDNGSQIRDFCNKHLPSGMVKGCAFYQLTKTEEIQDYKVVCIKDKNSGAIYSGSAARDMIGLPVYGTAKVAPGMTGQYEIYIQSTSVNRKLVGGTTVLYWPNAST